MSAQAAASGGVHALSRSISRLPDPIELFRTCCGDPPRPGTALLETAETAGDRGGKSLLVVRSAVSIVSRGSRVIVRAHNENGAGLLPRIARAAPAARVRRAEELLLELEFPGPTVMASEDERLRAPLPTDVLRVVTGLGGATQQKTTLPLAVGIFGYDLLDRFEMLPAPASDLLGWPDLLAWIPDQLIWLDHEHRTASVVAFVFAAGRSMQCYGEAAQAIVELSRAVEEGSAEQTADRPRIGHAPAERPPVTTSACAVQVDTSDAEYAALVGRLKEHIVAGDVFQIVPSRTFSLPCTDPLGAYRALRGLNPSPYMFYVATEQGVLFGASPETAIKVCGTPKEVHVRPIAGTRPRGRALDGSYDLDLDNRLEAELRLDAKELAEHMMLVDLARNDVARVCRPGTRRVARLLHVERYSHVMHLVSHVQGELAPELDALQAYAATMNMGTLVGAPKVKAAQLLRRYEHTKRCVYGGAVGYLAADGSFDSAIIIRSAVVQAGRAHVRAGAGVVYDSRPLAEADETRRKAEAVLAAVRVAEADQEQGT